MNKLKSGSAIINIKDKKRLIEAGKSALIVILAFTALLLAVQFRLFSDVLDSNVFSGVISMQGGSSGSDDTGEYQAAASPFCIVVTPMAGAHCAIVYDDTAVTEAYDRFSANLGEALGSAGEPEAISDEEWEAALSGCGVYFDFLSDEPLIALARWLGTTASGSSAAHTARRICLSVDDSGVSLYYVRAAEDTAYRCTTALSNTDVVSRIEGYLPDSSCFNFELTPPFDLVDACMVIEPGQLSVSSVTAGNPISGDDKDAEIMDSLGINSILAVSYPETDGSIVFVEGNTALRIEANGTVTFSRTDDSGESGSLSTTQAIETARAACERTLGKFCGTAKLYLSYIGHVSTTDVYYISFDYSVNGLPVSLTGGSAAEFTLTGNEITAAKMVFREYSDSDTVEKPLPTLQTAADVQASGGGEPVLTYIDDLNSVTANWIIKKYG